MTLLFMGGEMGGFVPADGGAIERTTAGSYDSSFSRCSIGALGGSSYCESASFAAQDELWVHACLTDGQGSETTSNLLVLTNASGTDLFRLRYSSGTLIMQYWNGSAFAQAGSGFAIDLANNRHDVDLYVNGNSATGTCSVYVSGTRRDHAASVDLSSVTAITKIRTYGAGNVSVMGVSQVVVSTESTIGGRLFTVPVSGAGASSDWVGTYANIDEVAYSDADFINSTAANEVSTFAVSAPTLTGYQVQAVAVTARARRGSTGPQNLQLALRSGGTTYFSSTKSLDLGYTANVNIWETDPATSAAWINTAVTSLQPGVKSIT